jgi:hypothetical protein
MYFELGFSNATSVTQKVCTWRTASRATRRVSTGADAQFLTNWGVVNEAAPQGAGHAADLGHKVVYGAPRALLPACKRAWQVKGGGDSTL